MITTIATAACERPETAEDSAIEARIQKQKDIWGERLVILAHHYQRKEVVPFGDFVGDSYYLSKMASIQEKAEHIQAIIKHISFKGGIQKAKIDTIEFQIVQDADRLDAMGAIGIARAFNYGGFKNRAIYDPEINLRKYKSSKEYHRSDAPTINHFYEKLLKLKDLMNTSTGKRIAEERHLYMEQFLEQFFNEWDTGR